MRRMHRVAAGLLLAAVLAAVLAATFAAYLSPHRVVELAKQLWSCF